MKRIFFIILALSMVILVGCGIQENPEITQNTQTNPKTSMDDIAKLGEGSEGPTMTDKPSDSSGFEVSESPTEDDPKAPAANPAEETNLPSQSAQTATTQESNPNPAKEEDTIVITGSQDEGPMESSVPEQTPDDTAPVPDPAQNPDPEPTQPPQTSEPAPEPEPVFDVSVWVSFAQSYGQQIGLSYDSTATDCWDNPILARAKSIYLERDITSRLDRYVRYGYTAFCVWSEQLPDGRYNIYIGYA